MITNRKFEQDAAYRSRLALLLTMLVYAAIAAFLLLRNGDVKLEPVHKKTETAAAAGLRP